MFLLQLGGLATNPRCFYRALFLLGQLIQAGMPAEFACRGILLLLEPNTVSIPSAPPLRSAWLSTLSPRRIHLLVLMYVLFRINPVWWCVIWCL